MAGGTGTIFSGQRFPLASGSKDIHDAIHYFSKWYNWTTDSIFMFLFLQNQTQFHKNNKCIKFDYVSNCNNGVYVDSNGPVINVSKTSSMEIAYIILINPYITVRLLYILP